MELSQVITPISQIGSKFLYPSNKQMSSSSRNERTYIMIKPDGVSRGLIGEIVKRFESKGYKLIASKLAVASEQNLRDHYQHLATKPFFPGILEFMQSAPVFCMVWEGKDVVRSGRKLLGETNPLDSLPGTIRGDFGIDIGRNICHGSDSVESAEREIKLWFPEGIVGSWTRNADSHLYE